MRRGFRNQTIIVYEVLPFACGFRREKFSKMASEDIETMDVDLEEKASTSSTKTETPSSTAAKRKGFQLPW